MLIRVFFMQNSYLMMKTRFSKSYDFHEKSEKAKWKTRQIAKPKLEIFNF